MEMDSTRFASIQFNSTHFDTGVSMRHGDMLELLWVVEMVEMWCDAIQSKTMPKHMRLVVNDDWQTQDGRTE